MVIINLMRDFCPYTFELLWREAIHLEEVEKEEEAERAARRSAREAESERQRVELKRLREGGGVDM